MFIKLQLGGTLTLCRRLGLDGSICRAPSLVYGIMKLPAHVFLWHVCDLELDFEEFLVILTARDYYVPLER